MNRAFTPPVIFKKEVVASNGFDPFPKEDSKKDTDGETSNGELDLMYDPILNCYFDPKTNLYYELKQ